MRSSGVWKWSLSALWAIILPWEFLLATIWFFNVSVLVLRVISTILSIFSSRIFRMRRRIFRRLSVSLVWWRDGLHIMYNKIIFQSYNIEFLECISFQQSLVPGFLVDLSSLNNFFISSVTTFYTWNNFFNHDNNDFQMEKWTFSCFF